MSNTPYMIHTILNIVVDDLNAHLASIYGRPRRDLVALINAAEHDFQQRVRPRDSQVYAHFLSLEKDHTYRNEASIDQTASQIAEYYKAQFNVYLLFVFNSEEYSQSLMLLSDVVKYYEGKRYLERDASGNGNVTIDDTTIAEEPAFRLEMIYHNVSPEDSYNMWSNLGNKQQPYTIFKLRIVEFDPGASSGKVANQIMSTGRKILVKDSN